MSDQQPTTAPQWQPGQRCVISRQTVVTIERVTPSGRAVAGDRTFGRDGIEICAGNPYGRPRLELLTPEIEAEIALSARGRKADWAASAALLAADKWLRSALSSRNIRIPDAADVDRAERLAEAIKKVMESADVG